MKNTIPLNYNFLWSYSQRSLWKFLQGTWLTIFINNQNFPLNTNIMEVVGDSMLAWAFTWPPTDLLRTSLQKMLVELTLLVPNEVISKRRDFFMVDVYILEQWNKLFKHFLFLDPIKLDIHRLISTVLWVLCQKWILFCNIIPHLSLLILF